MRCLPVNASSAQKANIAKKQQCLQSKIYAFNHTSHQFFAGLDLDITYIHKDDPHFCPEQRGETLDDEEKEHIFWGMSEGDEDEDEDESQEEVHALPEGSAECPLWLPSYLGATALKKAGIEEELIKEETQLRIGQANDSLEKLKTHLGHKSVLYRLNFRSSTSVRTDTRSKKDIRRVSLKISTDVRRYHRARKSLEQLQVAQDILQKFLPIKPDDLHITKDITEENRFGQSSDVLPWFWRIGDTQSSSTPWNEECKSPNIYFKKCSQQLIDVIYHYSSKG
jgi:hypothetical protein